MKTFTQWAEANKLNLPISTDTEAGKKTVSEKTLRGGIGAQYPDAYARSQYPHKYFNPMKGTADLDLQNAAGKK